MASRASRDIILVAVIPFFLATIPLALGVASADDQPQTTPGEGKATPAPMTQARMEEILREVAGKTEGQPGLIRFVVDGVPMACISDVPHDRMRLITPVLKTSDLTTEQMDHVLEANFHTALDARYAASHGVLYSVFVHPLSSLTEKDLRAAIQQVSTLAKTFGTSYSSGDLVFGGRRY